MRTEYKYAIAGILFGISFPVVATIIDLAILQAAATNLSILQLHLKNPLHLIIDSAPVVLGLAAYLIGVRQARIEALNEVLDEDVKNLFKISPDMLCVAGTDAFFKKINPAFEAVLGYTSEELLSKPFIDFIHPDDIPATAAEVQKLDKGIPTVEFENRYKAKDGSWKWFSWKANPAPGGRIYAIARDITDRKAEEEEQHRQSLLRSAILNSANFTIISTDPDGIILTWNSTAEELLGYSAEEVVGKKTPAIIHVPDEVVARAKALTEEIGETVEPGFEAFVAKSRKTGEADENEWTYIAKDGRRFPVLLSITTFRDTEGNVTGYLGIGKDLTFEKQAAKELRESEERIKRFLAALPIGIYIMGADGVPYYANEASMEILGRGIFPTDDPDELARVHQVYKAGSDQLYPGKDIPVVRALRGESVYIDDMEIERGDRRVPIEVWAKPVYDTDGNVVYSIAAFADITERQQVENEIRASQHFLDRVVENLPNMLFVKDAEELRFVRFNKAGEELLGYSRESLIGKNDFDLFPAEQADFFTQKDREVFESGHLADIPEEPIDTKHKGRRLLHTKKVPIFDEGGKPKFLLGISEDITEKKEAEEKLQQYAADLERSNQQLDEFAHIVSHDLKAPLRAISNLAEWVTEDYKNGEDQDIEANLNMMRNRVMRMEGLIRGILDYSRIGRQALEIETLDVRDLIDQILEMQAPPAGFEIVIPADLPKIKGTKMRLQQVFSNLISNAIKYHHRDTGRIEIGYAAEGEMARFSVADDGPGIEAQYHDRIFRMFQRLEARDDVEGTGIGLALVRKIVEGQGGKLQLESAPGEGSKFIFTWPMHLEANPRS